MGRTHETAEQLELDLGVGWRIRTVREILFFAIMPDAEAAARIGALGRDITQRYGLSGRLHAPDRLHVSLLGFQLDAHGRDELIALAKQIGAGATASCFDVTLTRALSFGRAPLRPLVLCCSEESAASLATLQANLFQAADEHGLGLRGRSGFEPHLTLAYREPRIPDTILADAISWPARELVLVYSEQGRGRYRSIGRWPLG